MFVRSNRAVDCPRATGDVLAEAFNGVASPEREGHADQKCKFLHVLFLMPPDIWLKADPIAIHRQVIGGIAKLARVCNARNRRMPDRDHVATRYQHTVQRFDGGAIIVLAWRCQQCLHKRGYCRTGDPGPVAAAFGCGGFWPLIEKLFVAGAERHTTAIPGHVEIK